MSDESPEQHGPAGHLDWTTMLVGVGVSVTNAVDPEPIAAAEREAVDQARAEIDRKIEMHGHTAPDFAVGRFDVTQVVRVNGYLITTCHLTVHLRDEVPRSGAMASLTAPR